MLVKRATKIHDDDIILTNSSIEEFKNCYYGLVNDNFRKLVIKMIDQNNVYYSTNEVAADFKSYVKYATSYRAL